MKLRYKDVASACMKHPGMIDEFLRRGKLDGPRCHIVISREDFDTIQAKYSEGSIGTLLHKALSPVANLIDHLAGTNLKECPGCALRELKLNNL